MKKYSDTQKIRMQLGYQCPECFALNTDTMAFRLKFECSKCGCQWNGDSPQFRFSVPISVTTAVARTYK
jgi:ribosomal protein L37AE/L43A